MELIKKLKEKRKKAIAKKLLKKHSKEILLHISNCISKIEKCNNVSDCYIVLKDYGLLNGVRWLTKSRYSFSIDALLFSTIKYKGGFGMFIAPPDYYLRTGVTREKLIDNLIIQHNLIVLLTNI